MPLHLPEVVLNHSLLPSDCLVVSVSDKEVPWGFRLNIIISICFAYQLVAPSKLYLTFSLLLS